MSAAPPDAVKQEIKILLVDDVELFIELEKTFFRREQFRLLTARSGEEALRIVEVEQPDLIFIALHLCGINGDEVCRRLKAGATTAHVPIVMVIQPGEEDLQLCRASGCDEVLFKPVKREDFLRASREQLDLVERLSPRIPAEILVGYGLRSDKLLQQSSVNLSTGGLFLATEAHLSVGTQLSLEIDLADGQPPLCCRGRIAWLNHPDWIKKQQLPHGMGIEFVDISEAQRQRLSRHLMLS